MVFLLDGIQQESLTNLTEEIYSLAQVSSEQVKQQEQSQVNEFITLNENPPLDLKSPDNDINKSDDAASVDSPTDADSSDSSLTSTDSEVSSSEDGYTFVDFLELDFTEDLKEFYKHYIVETPDGFIQVFQSLSYGEMLISFFLLVLIVLYILRWVFDVLFR